MTEQPQPPVGSNQGTEPTLAPTPLHGTTENPLSSIERAVHTDQFEVAQEALGEVRSLRSWRQASRQSSFSPFYNLTEAATILNRSGATPEDRAAMAERLTQSATRLSPRVRDLYLGLLATVDPSAPHTPQFEMTQAQLDLLKNSGDLTALQDPSIPWDIKLNRMRTRIETELRGRRELDKRDKEQQKVEEEEAPEQPSSPPPNNDESKPSMDEMERLKEGEQASAIWTVTPAYGGYYKETTFDVWDKTRNVWKKSIPSHTRIDIKSELPKDTGATITTITANLSGGSMVRIPIPYTRSLNDVAGLRMNEYILNRDENGDYLIGVDNPKQVQLQLADNTDYTIAPTLPKQPLDMPATLTEATEAKLADINRSRKTTVDKTRAVASYAMRHLVYSNDSSYNVLYENNPDGYIGAIDQFKKADCDVANTYFAALCAKLGIQARHVVGHMVKGKDKAGNARITSGTGHAWTEIWDKENQKWVRIDATPPGDPNMEEDAQDNTAGGAPGDYGEQEAIGPTDEELAKLEEKLESAAERLSYNQEERELAQAAGVDLKEARSIVKEIKEAEETKLPSGERVTDVLAQLWTLIARSRTTTTQEYTGPLRKREGGEYIEDIVAQAVGANTGEVDPATRQKEAEVPKEELIMSTLEVLIGGDKSGSMGQSVDGQVKWRLQRKAAYLILSSLDRAQKNLERVHSRLSTPLTVKTKMVSFRDGSTIDVDKPLSTEFTAQDKVQLWKSLGNQGSGNGDMALLTHYRDQIIAEEQEAQEQGKRSDAMRVLFICSDGEPDNETGVRSIASEIGTYNTTVVGVGLTEAAAKVPIIFKTPTTRGDLARDINDLPAIIAKHVVMEGIKLIPPSKRSSYERSVANLLAKFNSTGV